MYNFSNILNQFIRIAVGGLFIFSGLIKLNDPIGTQIKLKEYFEVFSSDFGTFFEHFVPWALPIGFVLIVIEVVLGIAVLLNYEMKKVTWALLVMIVFFTFLTFYSAYYDKVTDCGCFGDAIKLTPWESFTKDIVLLVFIAHLFFYRRKYKPIFRRIEGHAIIALSTFICIFLGIYAINHLPFVDFRAYKVGANIPKQMIPPEQANIEYVFEKNGEKVTSDKFLTADDGYKYLDSYVTNLKATIPKITDYNVASATGEDFTQSTFSGIKLFIIAADVTKSDTEQMKEIVELTVALEGKIDMMAITSSLEADFEAFRHTHQLAIPYYFADATVIKAMIRSNPGLMLFKDGTVLGKWHHNDVPTVREIKELL